MRYLFNDRLDQEKKQSIQPLSRQIQRLTTEIENSFKGTSERIAEIMENIHPSVNACRIPKEIVKTKNYDISSEPSGGLSSVKERTSIVHVNFSSLSGLNDIAKTISEQVKPLNTASMVLENISKTQFSAVQLQSNHSTLLGITSSLTELAKTHQFVLERLSGFATSQHLISNSLRALAKKLSQSHLNRFNGLEIALQEISKNYLKDISLNRNWKDIYVTEESDETIPGITSELLNTPTQVTVQDLDNLRKSIVTELFTLLGKTKTDKARQFIFDLMTIISFIYLFYPPHQVDTGKSNLEMDETRKEIKKN